MTFGELHTKFEAVRTSNNGYWRMAPDVWELALGYLRKDHKAKNNKNEFDIHGDKFLLGHEIFCNDSLNDGEVQWVPQ